MFSCLRRHRSPGNMDGAVAIERLTQATWRPDNPTTVLKGVGPRVAETLQRAGLRTLEALLWFFPRRYREVTSLERPEEQALGSLVRLRGRVVGSRLQWLPGRRSMVRVDFAATDKTIFSVCFFNQPYLKNAYEVGTWRLVQGILNRQGKGFGLKQGVVLADGAADSGAVQLRYPEIEGVSEGRLRGLIRQVLAGVDRKDWPGRTLPAHLAGWPTGQLSALRAMHLPSSVEEHEQARQYFAIHEAVELFRRVERARRHRVQCRGPTVEITAELEERIAARIPFQWTADQAAAVAQIKARLMSRPPMGLLLQGDVGTGKTAVAVHAALAVLANGYQAAFLAPTELLAEQHHDAFRAWLEGSAVRMGLVTAGMKESQRRELEESLGSGAPQLVFGTHAMLSQRTVFTRLGLVIIDEQHRFGVDQRMRLVAKGVDPHVLVMTATPIPRTLALTLFGDLDLATLRERPPGRRPVRAVFLEPRHWRRCLALMNRRANRGEQVYVVCPKIGEDGEKGGAVRMHGELSKRFRCHLVHGRMPAVERQKVTADFRRGAFPVLVGTTVLEVGIDVPNATLMVVVGAHRFGLSTLHQLRGRVGRGPRRGLCILMGMANARTAAICRTSDGFALAEEDLKLRGSGELLGTRQSGLGELRVLDPIEDLDLLLRARAAVVEEKEES